MSEYEERFQPEQIDEQIERLSSSSSRHVQADPGRRLLDDLHRLYRFSENEAKEDARSLERAWDRIAPVVGQRYAERLRRSPQKEERFVVMPEFKQTIPALDERRTLAQRVGVLAAAVFVALLVGSMAFVFQAARQHNSTVGASHLAMASPTVAPALPAAKPGTTITTYKQQSDVGVYGVDWSPDGTRIVSSGSSVHAWNAANGGHDITYVSDYPYSQVMPPFVRWSPDGKTIAAPYADHIVLWDATTNRQVKSFFYGDNTSPVPTAAAIKSGQFTKKIPAKATVPMAATLSWSPDGTSIRAIMALPSPNNRQTVQGDNKNVLVTWDVSTGAMHTQDLDLQGSYNQVAWSPDGKYIATAYMDRGEVYVIDLTTGKVVYTYTGGKGTVCGLAWSPDSKRIVSTHGDGLGLIHVWDATTGAHVLVRHQHSVLPVAWSPDGKYIVSGGDDTEIWDAATGKTVYTYKGYRGQVYALAWSPDSAYIAAGLGDSSQFTGEVKVWAAK